MHRYSSPLRIAAYLGCLFLFALWLALRPSPAYAADIDVTTIDQEDDPACTLREAIQSANNNSVVGNCVAGDDVNDTIILADNATYSLVTAFADYSGNTALPSITSTVTISGNGAIIERDLNLIGCAAPTFRLFHVASSGNLTLHDVTVQNGCGTQALGQGGGVHNRGALTLVNSRMLNNRASYGAAIFSVGSVVIIDSQIISNFSYDIGGGLFSSGGDVSIHNSQIISNTADDSGGGLYNFDSTVTLSDTLVRANEAEAGGGLYNDSSTAILTDTQVLSNTADAGGGLYSRSSSTVTLSGSEIRANRASNNGGGLHNDSSTVILTGTRILSNTAVAGGGGFYNNSVGVVTLSDSEIAGNTAGLDGGGLYNFSNTVILTGTQVFSNTAGGVGGGFYSRNNSTAILTGTQVFSNTADYGGGLYNEDSTIMLSASEIVANTADAAGGGIYNLSGSIVTLTDTQVLSNTATVGGGGLVSFNSIVTLTGSEVRANRAGSEGGGLFNNNSTVTLTGTQVLANIADNAGGGIYNTNSAISVTHSAIRANVANSGGGLVSFESTVTISGSEVRANTAGGNGGGFFNNSSSVTVTGTRIIANVASDGSAIYQFESTTQIAQSCIVNNAATAVVHIDGSPIVAANNWWGASDGPGGVAPGNGDSISAGVDFVPFLTSPILDCATRPVTLALDKQVTPAGALALGQPLTYTLLISNAGSNELYHTQLTDVLPSGFLLSQTITSGAPSSQSGDLFVWPVLAPGASASVQFVGQVDPLLTGTTALTNTGVLSHVLLATAISDQVVSPIQLPTVAWSQAVYTVSEESGTFNALLTLQPPAPFTTVTVEVTISDPITGSVNAAALQQVVFPPNSTSQLLSIPVADDDRASGPRLVQLGLQNSVGASIGTPDAALLVLLDAEGGGLVVSKVANLGEARAGDTIVYTYQITNTSPLTWTTIQASDDQLGEVPGLAGALVPGDTRSATLSYTVREDDPQGSLVNTVTVITGSDLDASIAASASSVATVTILEPTGLPGTDQPGAPGDDRLYLPNITQSNITQ